MGAGVFTFDKVSADRNWERRWAPYDELTYQEVLAQVRPDDLVLEIGAGDLRLATYCEATLHRGTVAALAPGWKSLALPLRAQNDDETPPFPVRQFPPAVVPDSIPASHPLVLYRLLGVSELPVTEPLYAVKSLDGVELSF